MADVVKVRIDDKLVEAPAGTLVIEVHLRHAGRYSETLASVLEGPGGLYLP